MIKSMTGFGKASKEFDTKTVTVEIRSLNSKGMDLSLRVSSMYREFELELRNDITRKLERGKVDLSIFVESKNQETPIDINTELAKEYHKKLKNLSIELNETGSDLLSQIIKLPDVLKSERKEANESEWKEIKTIIDLAVESLNKYREDEGKSIEKDFTERINIILSCLNTIGELDKIRISQIKNRIRNNIIDVIGADKIDSNRFEQEMIYYIEKLDINEEKVRLKTHCDYFFKTIKDSSSGRKLNFITQEIGREINTIGSKANDAEIQKLVVLMKDELEKIKEQTNNVL